MLDHLGKTAAHYAIVSQTLPVTILLECVQMAVVHQDGQGLIVVQVVWITFYEIVIKHFNKQYVAL